MYVLAARVLIKHKNDNLNDYKMISLQIKIPCDKYFSCSKVSCSKVYYWKL